MPEIPVRHAEIDCIVCGTCVADILVRPVPLAQPVGGGRLFHVEPIEATTGGIVCNTGIAMRRLGVRVAAASLVGDDVWGRLIRDRLAVEAIDADGLRIRTPLAAAANQGAEQVPAARQRLAALDAPGARP